MNKQPTGEKEDAGSWEGDLQVSPVTDEVSKWHQEKFTQTPEGFDRDAGKGSLRGAHDFHTWKEIK